MTDNNTTICAICGKDVPKRDYKVMKELMENSMFGFTPLCPDCAKTR